MPCRQTEILGNYWRSLLDLRRFQPRITVNFLRRVVGFTLVNGKPMGSEMASMPIDLQENLLCDVCSNAGRGVKFPGKQIRLECAGDDAELVKEIVRVAMPEMARKLEGMIKEAGIK
jgi:hypothetical protein